jgi:uncharacterized protein (UPF0332 family)
VTWDWRGYIELAVAIRPNGIETNDKIARARSAISRAYYGAYHMAWAYVRQKGYPIVDDERHGTVWQELMKHNYTADERMVGQHGQSMLGYRKKADYKLDAGALDKVLESSLAKARDICRLLNRPL